MAVTYTATVPTGVPKQVKVGNAKVAIRDVAADTGTYVTGGNSITAVSLGCARSTLSIRARWA
jgi:hypothetical protein